MENIQKIEQIVSKAGCTYEEARAALEANGWDMIDAIISLERDGKVNEPESGMAVQYAEEADEPIEVVPEVSPDNVAAEYTQKVTYRFEDASDRQGDAGSSENAKAARSGHRLWERIKRAMVNNRMIILRRNGTQVIDLPIVVPVIALIAFFWAVLLLALIAMAFGCRFHFEGEDLGKTRINDKMDKATDYAEKVRTDFANKVNEKSK